MDVLALVSVLLLYTALAAFLVALFTRMRPCARITRLVFFLSGAAAFLFFLFWGISRNF